MAGTPKRRAKYEAPTLVVLGQLDLLTLGCDKVEGGSDGFTFHGTPIVGTTSA